MNTSFKKKLSKYKRIIISIVLMVLGVGLTFLVMNVFAGTPPSSCPLGTIATPSECESCLELTAFPPTISVGDSSTLTLKIESKHNGVPNPSWTMDCFIDHEVLLNTTLNNGNSFHSVSPINTTTYTARCTGVGQNPATTEGSVTVIVINSPPTAAISCDPSGCNSSGCIGYTGCLFTLNNGSTDPDGQSDIVKSEWDIFGWGDSDDSNCINPLCDYTVPSIPPNTYTIQLYVEDSVGNSDTATKGFTIRREANAGFVCSLNNENWLSCDDISPSADEIIYFSDSQSSPLEHSSASEGASAIVSRKWEIVGGVIFSQEWENESNPQITLNDDSTIRLTITDDQGRIDYQNHLIGVSLPLPEWEESAP